MIQAGLGRVAWPWRRRSETYIGRNLTRVVATEPASNTRDASVADAPTPVGLHRDGRRRNHGHRRTVGRVVMVTVPGVVVREKTVEPPSTPGQRPKGRDNGWTDSQRSVGKHGARENQCGDRQDGSRSHSKRSFPSIDAPSLRGCCASRVRTAWPEVESYLTVPNSRVRPTFPRIVAEVGAAVSVHHFMGP